MLTQEALKNKLTYDPETGFFTWLSSGKKAGNLGQNGYNYVRVNYILYLASRLAHLYMLGVWPSQEIDHIDRNPSNDSWKNLRAASYTENKWNRKRSMKTKSGFKGVFSDSRNRTNPWYARITVNRKLLFLGGFKDPAEAARVYDKAAQQYFGEFASLNFPLIERSC
jgi:HNH endonuclease